MVYIPGLLYADDVVLMATIMEPVCRPVTEIESYPSSQRTEGECRKV